MHQKNHDLLHPGEVEEILRLPVGEARRLARRGKLAHVKLPGGEVRFVREQIDELIRSGMTPALDSSARQTGQRRTRLAGVRDGQ